MGAGRYDKVHSTLWGKNSFLHISDKAKVLYFYLRSSPHSNIMGFYMLKPGYVCEDLSWSEEIYESTLKELQDAGLVGYDSENKVILIKGYIEDNPITNENQIKSFQNRLEEIPMTPLLSEYAYMVASTKKGAKQRLCEVLSEVLSLTETGVEAVEETLSGEGGHGGEQVPPSSDPNGSDVFGKISTEKKNAEYVTPEEFQTAMKGFLQ